MTISNITRRVSMLAVLAVSPAAFAAAVTVEQLEMEREGVQMVRQLEEVARDVRYNAERLSSYNNSTIASKWTHIHHLDQIKILVNDGLRPALTRLTEIQTSLPEWKQQAIDKMAESAKALADDVNDAILAKRESGTTPPAMNGEYKALVVKIAAHAATLQKTADAAESYASARIKAHEAGVKLPHK